MANETLIPNTCNKCGKVSKVTRKEGWKHLIIQASMCPTCFKKNPGIVAEKRKKFIYGTIVFIFAVWLGVSETGQHLFWNVFAKGLLGIEN